MPTLRRTSKANTKKLTLGLAAYAKISAVEGISLSSESRRMFADFKRKGLSAEERRKAILAKHAKKA